eukprot:scaffold1072_cov125-Skeletonema_dohrnii-CCMP3373.AAC.4
MTHTPITMPCSCTWSWRGSRENGVRGCLLHVAFATPNTQPHIVFSKSKENRNGDGVIALGTDYIMSRIEEDIERSCERSRQYLCAIGSDAAERFTVISGSL